MKNVTLITDGVVQINKDKDDNDAVTVIFNGTETNSLNKYGLTDNFTFKANGAVIESYGPCGTTIEIIGVKEFSRRFRSLYEQHNLLPSGFCELHGGSGTYECKKGTCTGSCTLHSIPVYCSCD